MKKPILAFLLSSVCCFAIANGQGTASRVTGTVVDEKGSVVPGAVVTLTNEATQISLTTNTGSGGTYVFDSVQAGKYTISVEKQGFKTVLGFTQLDAVVQRVHRLGWSSLGEGFKLVSLQVDTLR